MYILPNVHVLLCSASIYFLTQCVVVPVITVPPTNQTVVSPDNATFTCTATAKPRAVIQWRRNGVVLTNTMKHIIIDSTEGDCIITNPPSDCIIISTLSITSNIPNDSGEYLCTASNPAGFDIAFVLLTVYGRYSFHRIVCNTMNVYT